MGKLTNMLFLLIVAFVSCNVPGNPGASSSSKEQENEGNYADIDYFNIRGVNPLKTKGYPSITIRDSSRKRIVTFYTNQDHFFSKEFFKEDFYWKSSFEYKADTSHIYVYEFILKDRVLIFNYKDTNSYILDDVSSISGNTVTIYFPNQVRKIKPSVANFDKVKEDAESKYTEKYVVLDSVLRKEGEKVGYDGRVVFENAICFHKNEKSIFWWIYFGHIQQVIDCS
ncbi:MAG: hypothetical protein ABWZ25_15270 [Chitinophagaceae bacterium]